MKWEALPAFLLIVCHLKLVRHGGLVEWALTTLQLLIMERRVKNYDLGLDLDNPNDVERAEVETRIKDSSLVFFAVRK